MKMESEVGDVVSVRCKVHGKQILVAGRDFSVESGIRPSCPYCQRTATGPLMCGRGYKDQQGVQFIVDDQGRIRHFDRLTEVEADRIREGKKVLREAYRKFVEEEK